MKKSVLMIVAIVSALAVGCATQTPHARAVEYKRAIDTARVVCVAVALDLEAPTDRQTIARCQVLRSFEP